jgi:phosphoribosylamine--glycine ligase
VLPRIKTDLVELLEKTYKKQLNNIEIEIDERAAATVMVVSGGYPEAYEKGKEIAGISDIEDSIVFHAGTAINVGKTVTNGGRVIAVTSLEKDFKQALKKSYQNVEKLSFDRMYYRTDIGFDLA